MGLLGGRGEEALVGVAVRLQFGIGVSIILFGVRTILGELVPAFQGIANKVVPGARPALDIPIVCLPMTINNDVPGTELSIGSMEIFRVVDGRITEVWNCGYKQGVWQ